MIEQLPILQVFVPLIGAPLCLLVRHPRAVGLFALLIAAITFLMWTLIFERVWYFKTGWKSDASKAIALWEGRSERQSWNAKQIREKLISLSDYDYTCTSAILDSPMDLSDYIATLRLFPVTEGNRCFVEWWAEFDCPQDKAAELAETVGDGMFQSGFDSLKKRYGQR